MSRINAAGRMLGVLSPGLLAAQLALVVLPSSMDTVMPEA
jgi:hypothetical protein